MGINKQFKKREPTSEKIVRTIRPFQEFMRLEASSGILLILCVIISVIWINSSFGLTHDLFWNISITFGVGEFYLTKSILLWVNDLLMAIFFLLIGLEMKREVMIGYLSSKQLAILPTIAAIGGMTVPVLIYLLLNPIGSPTSIGWAIPMATDIAIVLGLLSLFGSKVPTSLKVFVTALAIVDDIAGVIVISIFFSHGFNFTLLGITCLLVGLAFLLNRLGIRRQLPYIVIGIGIWISVYFAGIHPTIAGILIAMTIPATTKIDYPEFVEIADQLMEQVHGHISDTPEETDSKSFLNAIQTLEMACSDVEAPLQTLEIRLTPWVVFIIIPLFALANAGVLLTLETIGTLGGSISLGIVLGLVIGKPVGIIGFIWIAIKVGIVEMPETITWDMLIGAGLLTGIGFTIATFFASLAFPDPTLLESAKVAILLASLISAISGVIYLWKALKS